jgi:hypothetical protein
MGEPLKYDMSWDGHTGGNGSAARGCGSESIYKEASAHASCDELGLSTKERAAMKRFTTTNEGKPGSCGNLTTQAEEVTDSVHALYSVHSVDYRSRSNEGLEAQRLPQQGGGGNAHAKAKWASREEKDWRPEDGPAKRSKYVAPPACDADTEEVREEEFTTSRWFIDGTFIPDLRPPRGKMNSVHHADLLSCATPQKYFCQVCIKSGYASSFVFCNPVTGFVPPYNSIKVCELKAMVQDLTGDADAGFDEGDKKRFHKWGLSYDELLSRCCHECYGERFVEPESARSRSFFVNWGDSENFGPMSKAVWLTKPTAAWANICNKTQSFGHHSKRENQICVYIMNKALKTMDTDTSRDAAELFDIIMEQPGPVCLDPQISPDIFMLYRCARCSFAPLKLCDWVRSFKPEDTPMRPMEAEDTLDEWRCPASFHTAPTGFEGACLQKYGDGHGHGRVLVINRSEMGEFWNGEKYVTYFLGPDRSQEEEFLIQMLLAAKTLDKIPESKRVLVDGKFPAEDVVSAIEELNKACEKSHSDWAMCAGKRRCNYAEFKEKCPQRESYSCAPMWSFAAAGVSFKALYLPEETEVIDSGFKNDLLACLIAYHDFAGLQKPKNAGPKRNAYRYVQAAGPYYLQHRKAIPWDHPSVTGTALELLCTKSSLPTAVAHSIRQVPTALFGSGGLTEL